MILWHLMSGCPSHEWASSATPAAEWLNNVEYVHKWGVNKIDLFCKICSEGRDPDMSILLHICSNKRGDQHLEVF